MKTKSIMIQGIGSGVGKTTITAALCRILYQDGKKVTPFKAQNITLNTYITQDGHEIGWVQAMQAEAAGTCPTNEMNPILIKPANSNLFQIIIHGKIVGNFTFQECIKYRKEIDIKPVIHSYKYLKKKFFYIILEGAGSPAEINSEDVSNMHTASFVGAPVILVGDIDRGGVFASFIGTLELLSEEDRNRVVGFIINKYRGVNTELESGIKYLEQKTNKPVLGVIPYIYDIGIDEENSINETKISLISSRFEQKIKIDILYLPHISNFTDFDALEHRRGIQLRYITRKRYFDKPDIFIIPDTKHIIEDLNHLLEREYIEKILELHHSGTMIIGIGGGYQMLGKEIINPYASKEEQKITKGLGLFPFTTILHKYQITPVSKWKITNIPFYEGEIDAYAIYSGKIKMSKFKQGECFYPIFGTKNKNTEEGITNRNFSVWGTCLHKLFDNKGFCEEFIKYMKIRKELPYIEHPFINREDKEKKYNRLAEIVRKNIDMKAIYQLLNSKKMKMKNK